MALGARLRALLSRSSEPRTVISMHRERQVAVLSIVLFLLIGLPLWWTTTRVYRASLPADAIRRFAPSDTLRLPLVFHVDAETPLSAVDAREVEQGAQSLADAQRAHYAPGEWRVRCQPVVRAGAAPDAPGHYTLRLRADAAASGVAVGPDRSADVTVAHSASARDVLAEAIAEIVAGEERRVRGLGAHAALKYAPEYAVTLTLLNEDPVDGAVVDWDIESALAAYMQPLVRAMQPLTKLALSSQVLFHAGPPPVAPLKAGNLTYLTPEMLSHFANSPSWNLASVDPISPTLNFVLYAPALASQPLRIMDERQADRASRKSTNTPLPGADAFLVSQWGGVAIANLPKSTRPGDTVVLSQAAMQRYMGLVIAQLRQHLGVRSDVPLAPRQTRAASQKSDGSPSWVLVAQATDTGLSGWEFDALMRQWLVANRQTAITTLQSLMRLVDSLQNMVVMDEIKDQVDKSLRALHAIDEALGSTAAPRLGYLDAFASAASASGLAEAAFFDPTMVSMLYFPDQHKLAIYMPYFLPVTIPLLAAIKKIFTERRRAAAADADATSKKSD
ncbi:GPI transamidase component [Coemansia biformis]|uniref:GPI transamidase component n=1 Tax=Coemansia biformis TaxID=1286918 RepID=A0A9W7YDM6_9FUNG|nr:GPI transamidase component [Coemansia biformis]